MMEEMFAPIIVALAVIMCAVFCLGQIEDRQFRDFTRRCKEDGGVITETPLYPERQGRPPHIYKCTKHKTRHG